MNDRVRRVVSRVECHYVQPTKPNAFSIFPFFFSFLVICAEDIMLCHTIGFSAMCFSLVRSFNETDVPCHGWGRLAPLLYIIDSGEG